MTTKTIECVTCDGQGDVCGVCGETEDNCRLCREFEPETCEDCGGTGKDVVAVKQAA